MTGVHLEKGELNVKAVIAILATAVTLIIAFYNQVIIPIRDIQTSQLSMNIKMVEIQKTILDEKATYESFKTDLIKLKEQVSGIDKSLTIHLRK